MAGAGTCGCQLPRSRSPTASSSAVLVALGGRSYRTRHLDLESLGSIASAEPGSIREPSSSQDLPDHGHATADPVRGTRMGPSKPSRAGAEDAPHVRAVALRRQETQTACLVRSHPATTRPPPNFPDSKFADVRSVTRIP